MSTAMLGEPYPRGQIYSPKPDASLVALLLDPLFVRLADADKRPDQYWGAFPAFSSFSNVNAGS